MSFLCTPRTHTVGLSYSSKHMCKLGIRWRRVFSFTSHPPYTQIRNPRYLRSRRQGGLMVFWTFRRREKSLTPAPNQSITHWPYCSKPRPYSDWGNPAQVSFHKYNKNRVTVTLSMRDNAKHIYYRPRYRIRAKSVLQRTKSNLRIR
jgi:hypothetical protein